MDLLKKLVQTNSFTKNKKGVDLVAKIVLEELSFLDVETYESKNLGNLYVLKSKKMSKSPLLLCVHLDTVHEPEKNFEYRAEGNKIYGPGINDMKGSIYVLVEVLKKLHSQGKLKNIIVTLVPDEEMGSSEHKQTLAEFYKQASVAMVFEGGRDAERTTQYNKNSRELVVGRKGFGGAIFKFSSKGGHSGSLDKKELRPNSIQSAAHTVLELEKEADYLQGTTINPGIIEGGKAINVIASECTLTCDYRIKSIEERERIRSAFEKIAATEYVKGVNTHMEWIYDVYPLSKENLGKSYLQVFKDVAKKQNINLQIVQRSGGSDANQIAKYCNNVVDGMGPLGEDEHTNHEFIYKDSLEPTIEYNYEVIITILARIGAF